MVINLQWIVDNKEWLFSGVGITFIGAVIGSRRIKQKSLKQSQSSGKNSTNIQAGKNVNVTIGGKNVEK